LTRRLATVAAGVALLVAGPAEALTEANTALVGRWKVTRGGGGTFAVARRGGAFGFFARTSFRLGCVRMVKGDTVGFAELRSRTRLPKGVYSASFGTPGGGCSYNVRLTVKGKKMTAKVLYSEDGSRTGPFVFTRG
jgi:hypothetical protein